MTARRPRNAAEEAIVAADALELAPTPVPCRLTPAGAADLAAIVRDAVLAQAETSAAAAEAMIRVDHMHSATAHANRAAAYRDAAKIASAAILAMAEDEA